MISELPARLLSIDGPSQGRAFEVQREEWRVGRHPENDLQLRRMGISRFHFRLFLSGGQWWLEDAGSTAGTRINGRVTSRERLSSGDLIKVGDASFLFLTGEESETVKGPSSIAWTSRDWASYSTEGLLPDQGFTARLGTALHGRERLAEELRTLLDLAAQLPKASSPGAAADRALGMILRCVPSARAAVIWPGQEEDWQALATSSEGEDGPFELDSRYLETATRDGATWFRAEATLQAESSVGRSAMVVPLSRDGVAIGAIYVEAEREEDWDSRHLRWLDAVAGLLAPSLVQAERRQRAREEDRLLQGQSFDFRMVGNTPAMHKVFALITRVAPTSSTVLIRGESGTGKELVAGAVHRLSPRADGPFVAINCATFSANLLESELFGHERGAFTGAVSRRVGKLEAAHGGTLFLDEVGEIPLELQARLLRVLQEREFERVGGRHSIKVDLRLVAATNKDLEKAVGEGSFREDLFYRLNVIPIDLPPLRDRRRDVPALAEYFVEHHGRSQGRPGLRLSEGARRSLESYDWPGNVRELSNAIERGVVLAEGSWIELEDLPEALAEAREPRSSDGDDLSEGYHSAVTEAKKRILQRALEEADGSFVVAAERLGIRRTYLHRLVSNLGLRS